MTVFTKVKKEDLLHLKDFIELGPKTIYEELRLQQKEVTLILYTSEKLLLQGKKEAVDKIAEQLEKKGIGERVEEETFRKETGTIIGSDEALKGDTFGGMVIAAVKADDALRQKLIEMGVADSKTLSDKEIIFSAINIISLSLKVLLSATPISINFWRKASSAFTAAITIPPKVSPFKASSLPIIVPVSFLKVSSSTLSPIPFFSNCSAILSTASFFPWSNNFSEV